MKKLKVMTIVGTRPEVIRLSAVIKAFSGSGAIEHVLVHTGQNYDYELSSIFFDGFDLKKPDYFLDAAGEGAAETIGNILIRIDPLLADLRPDAFLVLGDTNSCLASIAAKRRHIPIFHMEAGNRCFDERVPEETNRRIADHISDINLPYSDIAREYLLREGVPADRIIKTGSPMFEVLSLQKDAIEKSDIIDRLNLTAGRYFVVSAHREENVDVPENLFKLADSLNGIAEKYRLPIIFSTHPRTKRAIEHNRIGFDPLVSLVKPLGFHDYVKLETLSKAVLSDSGTISEESSILGFSALNIRQAHERPEAMEQASVIMVGLERERILQGLKVIGEKHRGILKKVDDYMVPNVADKIVRIILSYTDYVNRVVWKKY